MVRTDLDGLPVEENTGRPYASKAKGLSDSGERVPVMHACGHDLHMTSFLGTATVLAQSRDMWRGTLDFSRYALGGEIPAVMFWLGAVDPAKVASYRERGQPLPSLHSSEFAPEAVPAIRTGVTAMSTAVLELMHPHE